MRRRTLGWIAFALVLVVLVGLGVGLGVFASRVGPGAGQQFVVIVPEGLTPAELARLLAGEGLVSNELLASMYLGLVGETRVAPGEHLLPGGSTPGELRAFLTRDPGRRTAKVTVPEGWTRFAIADRMEKLGVTPRDSFLRATEDPLLLEALEVPSPLGRGPESAEGFLFPATYDLKLDSPAVEIVTRLVEESHARYRKVAADLPGGVTLLAEELSWGRAEITTLASMIEKEAGVDDERPLIASVFLNRLLSPSFKPKLLQSDPTSAYGCLASPRSVPSCAGFSGKITPAMNRDRANRYSTYVREGLPPGPIANPGEKSLRAALDPARTDYLFFVAKGGGRHTFSSKLEDHQKAIDGP